jgi:hypothetical protein
MPVSFIRLLATAALFAAAVFAQDQNRRVTVRDVCIKVAPEKAAQFESFVREFFMPVEKALADNGEQAWWMLARAVVPMGKSAPCDYRGVEGFNGYPADPDALDAVNAALKRAKLNMTAGEMYAKLGALSELVDVEYWVRADEAGGGQEKGSYLVLNHYKTSTPDEWLRLETTYWKPLVAEHAKGGATAGWSAWEMWTPGGPPGDSKPYNVQTVDAFPNWNSLVNGIPLADLWSKVHPHEEMTPFFNADAKAASTYDRQIFKVVEIVSASNGSTR